MLRKVTEKTGASAKRVEFLASVYPNRISQLDEDEAKSLIAVQLAFIAQNYARQEIHPQVLKECFRLVLSKFKNIAPQEIKEAYLCWSAGELEGVEKETKIEMYGNFNPRHLGKVLVAYTKQRNIQMAELLKQQRIEQEFIKEKQQVEEKKEQFEKGFSKMIEDAKENFKDWSDVPNFWYDMLEKRGLINPTRETKLEVWEDAKELAEMEIENRRENEKNAFVRYTQEDLLTTRKTIARKVYVFRYFIKM